MASSRGPYKVESLEWLDEDKLMLLECWSRDGYTYQDIADKIGITTRTLSMWREKYPEINEALNKGREIVDYKVENALLKAALGYKAKETRVVIETDRKRGDVVTTTRETLTRDVAPNVTACQVWLYNRLPDRWKRNRDKLVELTDEDSNIQVTVTRAAKDDGEDKVNEQVVVKPKKAQQPAPEPEQDLDYWPDDWEDDDEDR